MHKMKNRRSTLSAARTNKPPQSLHAAVLGSRYACAAVLAAVLFSIAGINSSAYARPPFTSFVYPIVGPERASNFGVRKHPIYKVVRHHNGVDLSAPRGAHIRAVADGLVVFSSPYAGYGRLVVIQHKDGITTHYGHCDEMRVKTGARVKAGQIIATVGSTGNTTGPHLHFEIRERGEPLNPDKFLPSLTAQGEG